MPVQFHLSLLGGLSGNTDEEDGPVTKVGTSKTLEQYEGSTISLYGCGASGAYALGPERRRRRRRRSRVQVGIWLPMAVREKSKYNSIIGHEGPRIGVDKEDGCETEHCGTCVI